MTTMRRLLSRKFLGSSFFYEVYDPNDDPGIDDLAHNNSVHVMLPLSHIAELYSFFIFHHHLSY